MFIFQCFAWLQVLCHYHLLRTTVSSESYLRSRRTCREERRVSLLVSSGCVLSSSRRLCSSSGISMYAAGWTTRIAGVTIRGLCNENMFTEVTWPSTTCRQGPSILHLFRQFSTFCRWLLCQFPIQSSS